MLSKFLVNVAAVRLGEESKEGKVDSKKDRSLSFFLDLGICSEA